MGKQKIILSIAVIVVMISAALVVGVYAFNNTETEEVQNKQQAAVKSVDVKKILKSENIMTKLGTSPMDKATAQTYADKKVRAKMLAKAKKAKKAKKSNGKVSKKGYKYLGTFNATAYCGCAACCGSAGGHTASGTTPKAGRTIATDPSVIPLGSTVIIDGHEYTAEDTGGAIGGKRIDIFFSSHGEALAFGRRSVEVSIKK